MTLLNAIIMSVTVKLNKRVLKLKYLILFTLLAMNLVEQPTLEVTIAQGTLTGVVNVDGTMFEYLGIPYATANSSNRFQAPLPPSPWEGIFKANEDNYRCPQRSTLFGVIGTEDCLRMNIYVPALSNGPFAVMFSIHGGGFFLGNGGKLLHGPEFLIKQNVMLVSFNYRLGALGFLCLRTKDAPGNAGLKDQLAALRWVRKNIAAFGGDPDNITIFGESAGGASVSLFLASETTNGLFKRAIVQSGPSVGSWVVNNKPLWCASLLAQELGYNTEDPDKIYEIFSKLPYQALTKIKVEKPSQLYIDTPLVNTPCIEKQLPGIEPFLIDSPHNLISNNLKNVPIMIGTVSREGLFFISLEGAASLEKKSNQYPFADDLVFESEKSAKAAAERVKKFYFGEQPIGLPTIMNVSEFITHLYFEIPSIFETEYYLNKTKAKVFNYYFNYSGWRNFLKIGLGYINEPGSCHGDELMYMFKGRIWPYWITGKDQKIIDYVTKMWTNFAKYGDPTPDSASDLPIKWPASKKDDLKFMYIEDTLKIGSMPNPAAYAMWKDLYTKYFKKRM